MARALLIVDIQNDFCEGGALGVDGGRAVAQGVSDYLKDHSSDYVAIVASRDWHNPEGDNGGHFAGSGEAPNFVTTWPVHCVAGTRGADYHPDLSTESVTHHIKKGQGIPAYSLFEGRSEDGESAIDILKGRNVDEVDVVGIATDHCVLASSTDALKEGLRVRILTDLIAAVSPVEGERALQNLKSRGATLGTAT